MDEEDLVRAYFSISSPLLARILAIGMIVPYGILILGMLVLFTAIMSQFNVGLHS